MLPADLSPASVGCIISLSILAAISSLAVALRFWSRTLTQYGLHIEDWLSLVALIFQHACVIVIFVSFINDEFEVDVYHAIPTSVLYLPRENFILTILYGISSTAIRL
ncbi:hypothetical protein GGR54DRAFT_486138 [Hypoxylon sp. NC1633]|nr:hypothetical protein GGR54DRAFT_486138 [Hypoxylon sp. NC1633]